VIWLLPHPYLPSANKFDWRHIARETKKKRQLADRKGRKGAVERKEPNHTSARKPGPL
jgi:hypothetical protein